MENSNFRKIFQKVYKLAFILMAVGMTNSCTKNDQVRPCESNTSQNSAHSSLAKDYKSIIQSMGFNTDSYSDFGEYVIVEGDVMFKKEKLDKINIPDSPQKTTQATSGIWLNRTVVNNINIFLDPALTNPGPDDWSAAFVIAVNKWNSISDCHVALTIVSNFTNANIIVNSFPLDNSFVGLAEFPTTSNDAGSVILINLNFNDNMTLTTDQKVHNLVHEIGHTISFRHTNWTTADVNSNVGPGFEINHGCPASDPNSVMNGGTALNSWAGFSIWDELAAQLVYPDWASYVQQGGAAWPGTEAMTSLNNYVYAVQNSRLYKIDPSNGSYTQQGAPVWGGTEAMASLNGWVYIVQNSRLYQVDPNNGSYTQLGNPVWGGTEAMTSLNGWVYIVQNSRLYQVDPNNGSYTQLGGAVWAGTDAMTSYNNYLYIVENSRFYKVDPNNGSYTQLGGANWANTQAMGSFVNGGIFIIQNDMYYKVSPQNGTYQRFGGIAWAGTDGMTTIGNYNYVIENSGFYKVSTQ